VVLFNNLIKASHIRVESQLELLPDILDWFEQFNLEITQGKTWLYCQLALVEAFTNVVRHAHKNLPDHTPIDIEVSLFKKELILKIWDYGESFNLKAKLKDLIKNQSEDNLEAESGRGLILIEKTIDKISYTRGLDQRNCLILVKKIS
jgi:serine/threonine-protein kinase RsbW